MKQRLNELLNNSYSPYSKVKVSSILITKDGKEFEGVNVEGAAYSDAICAERNAMTSAIAAGEKAGDLKEIHIASNMAKPLYPCGHCLQMMSELGGPTLKVVIHHEGDTQEHTLKELLPYGINKGSFGWE